LSDAETLIWQADADPVLRSGFSSVTFLDRTPDVARFRRRMARAASDIPRLRQRVVASAGGIGPAWWVDDPDFDLAYHVRHIALPAPGTRRQLLDLAAVLHEERLDPARPLWQFTIVEGLERGEAALITKMHHALSDGVGAIRISAAFTDLEPDPPEAEVTEIPMGFAPGGPSLIDVAIDAVSRPVDVAGRAVAGVRRAIVDPLGSVRAISAVAHQTFVIDRSRSELWAGRRSGRSRFEIATTDLADAKAAAKALGGTLNDFYVTALAGAAGRYHRAKGATVDQLRTSIPVNVRSDRSAAGNAFVPTRVLVPAREMDPASRFAVVHDRLSTLKADPTLTAADGLAAVASLLPGPLVRRIARSQVGTVDFAASNVRGAPFDLFIAGATILGNHPFGPTAGTAFNATLLSYRGGMDIGINIDPAAVDDGELLRHALEEAFDELVAAA
jgi:WS/DGAT/MGAT family acyltransferase